jgi:hypothetical protein
MVNIPNPATDQELRQVYWRALNKIRLLPIPFVANLQGVPWRHTVNSIAFTLMGCPPLDRGYENAAEQTLSAICGWFNHPQFGPFRRTAFPNVYLLVPHSGNAFRKDTASIEFAWKRAWK